MKNKMIPIVIIILLALILAWFYSRYRNDYKSTSGHPSTEDGLQLEMSRTCGEADRYFKIFQKKYPTPAQQSSNAALNSEEWQQYASWQQACDTAEADLDQLR